MAPDFSANSPGSAPRWSWGGLMVLACCAQAATLHVAPNGSDSNPGATPDKPVQTLGAVGAKLAEDGAITEVIFAAGTYPGSLHVNAPKGNDPANPPSLIIRAAEGAEVILDGARSINQAEPVANAPGVFSVQGQYSMAPPPMMWEADTRVRYLAAADLQTVQVAPSTFFARDNVLFFHTSDGKEPAAHKIGVSQYEVGMFIRRHNTTVQGIRFHSYLLKVWSSAIDIRSRMTVRNCAAWNCNWGFLGSGETDGAQILNCRAEDCAMGVYVNGKNVTVEGCTLLKIRDGFMVPSYPQDDCGIQFYFPAGDGVIRGNVVKGFESGIFMKTGPAKYLVEHNTLLDGHYGITRTAAYKDCAILRNVIVNFFTPIAQFDQIPLHASVDYNCLWLPRSNDEFFRSLNGPRRSGVGLHDFVADPRFASPEKNDFRLLPDSPCIILAGKERPIGALGAAGADFKDADPPVFTVSLLPPAVSAGPSGKMMFERDPWIGGGRSFVRDLVKEDDKSGFVSPIPQITLLLNATDAVSGLAKLQWRINGGEWSKEEDFFHKKEVAIPDPPDVQPAGKDGAHEIALKIADKAGNWSAETVVPVRLARAKPSLTSSPTIYANDNGVIVSFQTTTPCMAAIEYGADAKYGDKIEERKNVTHNWDANDGGDYVSTWDEARTQHHIAFIPPLIKSGRSYHYRIILRDKVGNEAVLPDAMFKTKGKPRVKPRVINVAKDGRDEDGRGAENAPFATLQFAVDRALPGDKIIMAPGLYFGETYITHGGVEDAPLTIEAAKAGSVVLDGLRKHTPLHIAEAPYLAIRGIEVRWYAFPGAGVFLVDAPHFTISECKIWNDWWSGWPVGYGVFAFRSPHLTADHNVIYRQESGVTLLLSPHSQITFNTMFHNLYNGPSFLFSTEGSVLRNNSLCFNGNDIVSIEELTPETLKTFDCDDNNYGTDLSEHAGGVDKITPEMKAEYFEVKDQRMRSGSKAIIYCSLPGVSRQRYRTMKEWREFSGKDKRSIFADPKYVNPQEFDLHLQPGSPNIGAGEKGATIGALDAAK
ncbi:MAG: right-handed parallel beta-helix repeat-containing protein [Verrucomicrobia bacterium]|nr:right-handed parallel beta-helix repeat-containing protein [Verrucomicrobiota bacterium]